MDSTQGLAQRIGHEHDRGPRYYHDHQRDGLQRASLRLLASRWVSMPSRQSPSARMRRLPRGGVDQDGTDAAPAARR